MIEELVRYRELLISLTLREIRVRYKQSSLGVAWALFLPLTMMLIFTFVFTRAIPVTRFVDLSMPYAIFAYIGLLPWVFFATSLTQAVSSLVANSSLVTKIYFPREMFPLSSVASAFVDFLIGTVVLVGLVVYYHFTTDWTFALHPTVLLVPIVLCIQILLTLGLAMVLSMANLFYRDVRYVFSVLIQLWMFLTAVIYPLPSTMPIVSLNPMSPIISAYRDLIVRGQLPEHATPLLYAAAVSIVVFLGGWRWFHATEFKFAERI
ncbi:MAG: ABC transporter permease [Phycisphaerae bacterium]|nr:ABC transporter permease [Phycisphaerae bacterium]